MPRQEGCFSFLFSSWRCCHHVQNVHAISFPEPRHLEHHSVSIPHAFDTDRSALLTFATWNGTFLSCAPSDVDMSSVFLFFAFHTASVEKPCLDPSDSMVLCFGNHVLGMTVSAPPLSTTKRLWHGRPLAGDLTERFASTRAAQQDPNKVLVRLAFLHAF